MREIKKEKINAYIMAIYIFQFGFLQPIASIVNSQLPVAGFSLLLVILALFNNKFKIKTYILIILGLVSVYFFTTAIIFKTNQNEILNIYIGYLLKCFSAVFIASIPIKGKRLYEAFLKLAIVNFFAIVLFPFTNFLTSMNYMRFGYAMVPSVMMFFYAFFNEKKHKPIWLILTSISTILTTIYGSRGPLLVLIIFIGLLFLFSKKVKKGVKTLLIIFGSISTFIIYQYQLVTRLLDYIYFDLGVRSYALAKFRMQLSDGLAASSSGRDRLYGWIFEMIRENPFFGSGIGVTQAEFGVGMTPHNIFLQILVEAGIVGLIIWFIFWIFLSNRYIRLISLEDSGYFKIATLVIASSIGRLLISSDIWLRTEYWFAISLLINFNCKKLQGCEKV